MANGKVLITGGAGFIGSHLAHRLHLMGKSLVIVDDLSTGRLVNIAELLLTDRCHFVHGKAGPTLATQPQLLEGVEQVYHLAAAVGVKLVVDDPVSMIRNNVEETAQVLEAVAKSGACVLIASTSEVYGKNPNLPLAESHDLHYGPTTSPRWAYGMSKALDEHLALSMQTKIGLRPVITRLFNTIGPRQVGHYGMVVPRFVKQAVTNADIEIHGDGEQTRAFCDARDVVRAMVDLLSDAKNHGQIFNLGNDREISINQLADKVIALAASSSKKIYRSYESIYGNTFEDPRNRVPDLKRLRTAIGFEPMYNLDQTLSELITLARTGT